MPVPISWAPPSAGDLRHLRFPFRSHLHREGILAAVEEMVAPADVLAKAVAQDESHRRMQTFCSPRRVSHWCRSTTSQWRPRA